jgi:hypothetical protein
MIDVKKPLRKAYYELLNGSLLYNAAGIPVSDDIKKLQDAGTNIYVLISTQSGSDTSSMQSWDSDEDLALDIVFKASSRANRQAVDDIANQILGLLLPSPGIQALPSQTGIQINCVRLTDDRYLDMSLGNSTTMTRRRLTFRQHIRQTLDTTPMTGLKGILHVKSPDFSGPTDYLNGDLVGKSYEVFLNDTPKFLEFGTDWEYIDTGGFRILLPNFNATLNNYNIYVLLK